MFGWLAFVWVYGYSLLGCVAWVRAWSMLSGWLRTCFVCLIGCVACFPPLLASLCVRASLRAYLSVCRPAYCRPCLVRALLALPASRPNTFVSPGILPPPPSPFVGPSFLVPSLAAGIYLSFASVCLFALPVHLRVCLFVCPRVLSAFLLDAVGVIAPGFPPDTLRKIAEIFNNSQVRT